VKQPKPRTEPKPDPALEVVEATIRDTVARRKADGVDPASIRVAVWQALEPALPSIAVDQRRRFELAIHAALDDVLIGEPT
jgi:xanthine dehydrogenase molybdopterin-binding subunit B